jgi:protein TonB
VTVRRDYLAAFLAAVLLHASLLAALGPGGPAGHDRPAGGAPAGAPPLAVSLLPALKIPAAAAEAAPAGTPEPPAAPQPAATEPQPAAAAAATPATPAAPEAGGRGGAVPESAARPPAQGRGLPAPERVKPRLNGALDPVFPLAARLRGEEGDVRLKVELTAAGRVAAVRLLDSSGYAALDRAALRAARRGSFAPALAGGKPVAGELIIRVRFRLKET